MSGTITDSTSGQPLQSAEVSVTKDGSVVTNTQTDGFGRYTVHNMSEGSYVVSARMIGFRPQTHAVSITASGGDVTNVDFKLVPAAVSLSAVTVSATVPIAVDTRTGDQVFQQNEYHGAPTNTTSQILQLSIAGAARAPTGEVHIRGQHAEYTYYVDGVPVPREFQEASTSCSLRKSSTRSAFRRAAGTPSMGTRTQPSSTSRRVFPQGAFMAKSGVTSGAMTRRQRRAGASMASR